MSNELLHQLSNVGSVALIAHVSPDMDTLGSCLGAMYLLRQGGFSASVFCADDVPPQFDFLPGMREVQKPTGGERFDLAIAIDMPSYDRMGACSAIFENAKARFVVDHHKTNSMGQYPLHLNKESAATAEMLLAIVKENGLPLNRDAAMCLYAGLSTDSGNFSYSSVTAHTLEMAAFAVSHGADPEWLTKQLYRTRSLPHLRLLGRALDTMQVHEHGRIALLCLSKEDLAQAGGEDGDLSGIVNYGVELKGVDAAAFITERAGKIRCSFRSNERLDSAAVAQRFGGGGHARAAGADIANMDLDEAKQAVLCALKEALC